MITANPPYSDNKAPDDAAAMFWDKGNRVLQTVRHGLSLRRMAERGSGSSGFEYYVLLVTGK